MRPDPRLVRQSTARSWEVESSAQASSVNQGNLTSPERVTMCQQDFFLWRGEPLCVALTPLLPLFIPLFLSSILLIPHNGQGRRQQSRQGPQSNVQGIPPLLSTKNEFQESSIRTRFCSRVLETQSSHARGQESESQHTQRSSFYIDTRIKRRQTKSSVAATCQGQ